MKAKVLTSSAVAITMLAGALSPLMAFAQEGSSVTSPSPKPMRTEIKQKIEVKKEEIKAKKEEKKEEKKDKNKERVQKFWNNHKHRLEILIGNQKKLADRIEKNLDKQVAKGKDVAEARAKLATARTAIADAEAALKDADGKVAGIISSKDAKEALKQVNELSKGIMAKIKVAHQALTDVLKTRKVEKTPTPSASPAAN
jgi:hypothetical protein